MLVFTMKVGEAITISDNIRVGVEETAPYRHHFGCWLCKSEGVLEFEPDALQPSWTECGYCGLDNEIPPGVYSGPAIIPGQIPSRMI
jgi:hypothetical protein